MPEGFGEGRPFETDLKDWNSTVCVGRLAEWKRGDQKGQKYIVVCDRRPYPKDFNWILE